MLTPQQRLAVEHVYGPMMVTAGPGSGKTRVLTERVRRLMAVTDPCRIAVFTFARKAAREMQDRFLSMTDEKNADMVRFGTFHSIFFGWLKEWGCLKADVHIVEESERLEFLYDRGWDPDRILAFFDDKGDGSLEEITALMPEEYASWKRARNAIDFTDILTMTDRVMEDHCLYKDIDFFLIDEFQDIDPLQYRIVRHMVCPPGGEGKANLFVVGDEDQSIYAFRGSDPGIFLHFQEDFPGCRRVDLDTNFRCASLITGYSQKLIRHNEHRFDKTIKPAPGAPDGSVTVLAYFDEKEEARSLCRRLSRQRWFRPGKNTAVLCRTRAECRRMMEYLQQEGCPYQSPLVAAEEEDPSADNTAGPSDQGRKREVILVRRDMEDLIRFAKNPCDKNCLENALPLLKVLADNPEWRRCPEGEDLLGYLLKQPTVSLKDAMEISELKDTLEVVRRQKDGDFLKNCRLIWLHTDYLSQASKRLKRKGLGWPQLIRQMLRLYDQGKDPVAVLTMHGAKGLEFDRVILPGLAEGKCPRKEAIEKAERGGQEESAMEEERRLFYVAVTRAKKKLVLSYYRGMGRGASRFLKEMGLDVRN